VKPAPRILVVAGVASGVGKTTITLGLLEAYRRRGLTVQAFKVGPDFIDPGFHELVTGRPSYTLDGWMCPRERVLACVAEQAADADLAVVEGVMGCFDGSDGRSDDGSTAQVAKWLGAPVVLVVDASAASRSVAAVVLGFERFDAELSVAAVIANRVAGEGHARWVTEAIAATCRATPVGAVRHDAELTLRERHLGLVTAPEGSLPKELAARLGEVIERSLDLDRLLAIATPVPGVSPRAGTIERTRADGPPRRRARIGVARDIVFQFYYAESLDLLRRAGADLVFWSPIADQALPDVDGLYLGGGYPELHARRLSDNAAMRRAVRRFAEDGRPIYAECGGLMFLAEALEDLEGVAHPMVGVLPTTVRMRPRRMTLGYTEVRTIADSPLGGAGAVARGHEFHFSTIDTVPPLVPRVYRIERRAGDERAEGYLIGQTLMSYVHLHFASNLGLAPAFVEACARTPR
jgi:cobyrinic acid a,c-diamide synthase